MYQRIDFTKDFQKQFKKLDSVKKRKFTDQLRVFQNNPFAPELRNHALKGRYVGFRSIDIAWDLRALYYLKDDTVVIFAFVGTHSQLY
jgi:addiction module RelE/StbE family toxin